MSADIPEEKGKKELDAQTVDALKEIKEQHAKEQPTIQFLGEFKMKDKVTRTGVKIAMEGSTRPLTDLIAFHIRKVHGQNNKIQVFVEWKPEAQPAK